MQFCIPYIQNCISSIIKFITDILPADRSNFHLLTNLLQISQPYGYHHTSPKTKFYILAQFFHLLILKDDKLLIRWGL